MKIVDLSGFMFSGKSAASDILREFGGVYVPNYLDEFDLLRMPGGLIDLKNSVMDWSPIRTYGAVCRFSNLVESLAIYPRFPTNLFKSGYGYAQRYPDIIDLKDQFIKSIMACHWDTPWPYADLDDGPIDTFIRKSLRKFTVNRLRKYFLVDKFKFEESAQKFVQDLLVEGVDTKMIKLLVTHNALEPFSPGKNLNLLGQNAICIVVDRDPRDIYATAVSKSAGFNVNVKLNRMIAGAHNVETFIRRYLTYRQNIDMNDPRVLRLRFEDIVLNYEQTLQKIYEFTGTNASQHLEKKKYFNPEKSSKNIGLWESKSLAGYGEDFKRISRECGFD